MEVLVDGEPLGLGPAQQRAVLGLLLVSTPEALSLDRLIDELWGERPPSSAGHAVQVHMSGLRKLLRAAERDGVAIRTSPSGYRLEVDPEQIDARRFERLVNEAQRVLARDAASTRRGFEQALRLWRGTPLAECARSELARRDADRLEELRGLSVEGIIEARLACGEHAQVIGELTRLVAADSLRERPRWLLMLALYRGGRHAEALAAYHDACAELDGIGLQPGPELRRLEEAILRHDPSLALAKQPDDRYPSAGAFVEELAGDDTIHARSTIATAATNALPERMREAPATAYVGRVAERERLVELWGHARAGALRLALIGGDAGVGKTRLSTELALELHGDGATVLYGRCDEDLGVPYQPWVEALRHLVNESSRTMLETHVRSHRGDVGRLVPALGDRIPELASPSQSDPETERYLLYNAVAGMLEEAGKRAPLLLILDDLHWADAPTLSLLRYIVAARSSMALMIAATYRDSELPPSHPLTALLAALHREQGVERIELSGLGVEDVVALMEAAAGHQLDKDGRELAGEIARETDGNPFFTGELLRHLTESGALVQEDGRWRLTGELAELGLPQSVREVLRQRVERLGSEARPVLSAAAVIGRDFDLELLLSVVDLPQTQVLDLLEEAVAASLLKETRNRAGHFTFAHALVEHALYDDLSATRRALLHRRTAEALEERYGDEPGERLGELAAHWAAAIVSTDATKAIDYARRAGERALKQLAPEEAVRWYRQAFALHERTPDYDRTERCEILIGLGEAKRQSGDLEYRQTLLEAAGLAEALGDVDQLCRAVLANSRGWTSQVLAVDSERVRALEAASRALPNEDPRRGEVLALLGLELHYSGDPARCRRLAAEAVEISRAFGDPAAFATTLLNACWAVWTPDMLNERERLTEELVDLARELNNPSLDFWAASRQWEVAIESGDRTRAESAHRVMGTLADSVADPCFVWLWLLDDSLWALIRGDLQASEQRAHDALEAATAAGQPDGAVYFGAQLFTVRDHQGRAGELVELMMQIADGPDSLPAWRAGAAISLIRSGRGAEACEMALAEDFQSVPWDATWAGAVFNWARVCSELGLADRSQELYELLLPFEGQFAAGGCLLYGSIAGALGRLATTLERYEQADDHFMTATRIEERLGAPLFLAGSRAGWARSLIARGRPDDLNRGKQMLESAEETARRLGGGLVALEVADCEAALAATKA